MGRRIIFGLVGVLVVVAIMGGVAVKLWQESVIDLPAVAVRGIGRVAGVASNGKGTTVQLPVKFHRQEHSLSCEIATLKMALGRYGVDIPESDLIAQLPFDPTPKGGGVWGDPNKGFVGSIDGKMLVDGYGVYWDPIARVGARYKRMEVLRNSTAVEVAKNLEAGRPVIIWGYYGRYKAFNWKSATAEPVQAVNGEHTRIVTGYSGPVHAPTSFSLIDPIFGPMTWSTENFMENWTSLGRHGVVVYPEPRWVQVRGEGAVWEISEDGKTRQWIKSWKAFENRGGFAEAIVKIDNGDLLKYKRGNDIEE